MGIGRLDDVGLQAASPRAPLRSEWERAGVVAPQPPERRALRVEDGGLLKRRAVYDGDGTRRKRLDEKGTVGYAGDALRTGWMVKSRGQRGIAEGNGLR